MGGSFHSDGVANVKLQMSEFDIYKEINWNFHVDTSVQEQPTDFDILVGQDLMSEMGISIDYFTRTLTWAGITCPMKNINNKELRDQVNRIKEFTQQSAIL